MSRHYPIRPVLRRGRIEAAMGRPVREPRSAISNLRPMGPKLYDAVAEGWVDPPDDPGTRGVTTDPDPTPPKGMPRPSMDDIIRKHGSL